MLRMETQRFKGCSNKSRRPPLSSTFWQKSGVSENPETPENIGDRERIRTAGLPLRRRTLYPAELHNLVHYKRARVIISQSRQTIKACLDDHANEGCEHQIERQTVQISGFRDEDQAPSDDRQKTRKHRVCEDGEHYCDQDREHCRDPLLVGKEEYREELGANRGLADKIAEAEYRFPYASP